MVDIDGFVLRAAVLGGVHRELLLVVAHLRSDVQRHEVPAEHQVRGVSEGHVERPHPLDLAEARPRQEYAQYLRVESHLCRAEQSRWMMLRGEQIDDAQAV